VLYLVPMLESRIQDDWYSDFSVRLDAAYRPLTPPARTEVVLTEVKSIDIQASQERPDQQVVFHLKYKKTDLIRLPIEVTERVGKLLAFRKPTGTHEPTRF